MAVELAKNGTGTQTRLAPSPFELVNRIRERARTAAKTIVLPEAFDPRVVQAAGAAVAEGLAKIILVGDPEALHRKAAELETDIEAR